MKVSKTLNPLHFEDLDPHRFEDLIRQLAYDFREWTALEATGRSGSDEGYDARGREKIMISEREEEDDVGPASEERIWLIQSKREKTIGPKDIIKHLDSITTEEKIHGIVFAAACDFSKRTRDVFFEKIREKGISEGYLWGKAELEDMLFQPKNDHLLFAYFGTSLSLHKRSLKTAINSKLTIKRKLLKVLNESSYFQKILLRDVDDKAYPDKDNVTNFKDSPPWILRGFKQHYHDGIVVLSREYYAFANLQTKEWDFYENVYLRGVHIRDNFWEKETDEKTRQKDNANDFWYYRMKPTERAWFRAYFLIPYERIVAIDEFGDNLTNAMGQLCPHLYVIRHPKFGFTGDGKLRYLVEPVASHAGTFDPDRAKRIKYFPNPLPEISKEEKEKFHENVSKGIRRE